MRWLTYFYDFTFKSTATATIGIHTTKTWLTQLSKMQSGREDTLEEQLYSHLHHHSASQRHNIKDRRMNKRHIEDFFTIIFTSHFICKVWKGLFKVACERVLGTEHKLHILTPLLWPSRCVFLVLLMLGSIPSGLSARPLGRVWPSLPHLVSSCLEFSWQLLWHPNSTELNNNSTPTRSPTGSLKSNV